ncbi:hypothetical protein LINGRAHAP2_LOCUS31783 [Linum grandiflorum]
MVGGIEAEETNNPVNRGETCRFVLTHILIQRKETWKQTRMAETNRNTMIIESRLIFHYFMEP